MKKGLLREWIIAGGIFFFSLFTIFYLIPSQIECTEEYDLKSLSPVFFPEVSAALIAVLSILLMITLFRSNRHPREEIAPITWGYELRVIVAMGIAVAYVLAFKYIGFIPASLLGLGGLFWLQGKRQPLRLCLLSVGTTLFVYFIFYYIMKVRFIEGRWWQ